MRHELLRGFVVGEPLAGGLHGRIVGQVTKLLKDFVDPMRLGAVYAGDTGFVLARHPDTVRGPDVAFVSTERLCAIEDERRFIPGAPDLAVDVLSPHDRMKEVLGKVSDYLDAGCRLVWVVDPAAEEVHVFRSPFAPEVLTAEDTLHAGDVLPGFSVQVAQLFRPSTR